MLMDMGEKREEPQAVSSGQGPKVAKVHYTGFSMRGDKIPEELKTAKNGQMCRLEIVVRKIGDNIDTYTEDEPRRIEVEIRKLGYLASAGKKNKDEYLKMNSQDREEYDKQQVYGEVEDEGEKEDNA